MNYPWLFIVGVAMLGWFIPEFGAIFGHVAKVPTGMNIACSIACGLVAASFVL